MADRVPFACSAYLSAVSLSSPLRQDHTQAVIFHSASASGPVHVEAAESKSEPAALDEPVPIASFLEALAFLRNLTSSARQLYQEFLLDPEVEDLPVQDAHLGPALKHLQDKLNSARTGLEVRVFFNRIMIAS